MKIICNNSEEKEIVDMLIEASIALKHVSKKFEPEAFDTATLNSDKNFYSARYYFELLKYSELCDELRKNIQIIE